MIIIGVDFHPEFQQIALVDTDTGEFQEKRLAHREDAETFHRTLAGQAEDALTRAIVQLAAQYGRYGYRRITMVLQRAGWNVGRDRVQRIWRREGLKVPEKQKPRGRLRLNDGSCVRLRREAI